jgi:hypothetical protein
LPLSVEIELRLASGDDREQIGCGREAGESEAILRVLD